MSDRERYERHAAPEAIAHRIRLASERIANASRELRWLSALQVKRLNEVRKGEWPYAEVDDE